MAWSERKLALVLIAISATHCTFTHSPDEAYRHAWSLYVSGDLPAAARELAPEVNRRRRDADSPWHWKFRLLDAEVLLAQGKRQEAEALLRDSPAPKPELEQLEIRRLLDLAASLDATRSAEAEAMLARARARVRDPELAIRLQLVEGVVLLNQRKTAEAEAAFRSAADMAGRQAIDYWQAQALSNLAYACRLNHRYEESVEAGLRALAVAEKTGARRVAAQAHGNLGSTYSYLGEFEQAVSHEEQSAKMLEQVGDRANLAIGLGELGLLYDRQGDTAKAAAAYQRAYQLARELGRDRDAERHAENLSLTLIKDRQWDQAAYWSENASRLADLTHDQQALPYLARNRASIAFGRGQAEEAARICRDLLTAEAAPPSLRWEVLWLQAMMDSAAQRSAAAGREFQSALEILEGTRSELLRAEYKMTLLSRLIPFYQDYVEALVQQGDDAGALRVVESSRARVLAERLGRDQQPGRLPTLDGLRRLAAARHAALLSFWTGPSKSYAWLIAADGVRRFDLPAGGEIEQMVTRYRQSVEHSLVDPVSARDAAGAALWNGLLAQIAPRIPAGSRLVVIPDGALHRLNLETLVAPAPQPHYWIEDVELAVAPSIAIALSAPAAPDPRRPPSLLLIGAPDYAGTGYAPLPQAAGEIRGIQEHFAGAGRAVFTGAEASPAAYRDVQPGRFSLIHFAAHAEANSEEPLESAIVLARRGGQFKLYARDVIGIPIHADLVTISSCRSAGMRAYAGEGLIGFAWAFLEAGARDVVAGLWDVNDASTATLMDRFYGGLGAGQDPAQALRNAKLALLHGEPRYRKPFYWAPFQVYSAGSAR
jgi:CHAT domain-containing protein